MLMCIFLFAIISTIAVVSYIIGSESSQEEFIFELSTSNNCAVAEYYALKKDGTLIWAFGRGRMGNFTYGCFFSSMDERGIVYINEPEKEDITFDVKQTVKNHKSVPSNISTYTNDASEILVKYKNKYYSQWYSRNDIAEGNSEIYELCYKLRTYVDNHRTDKDAYIQYFSKTGDYFLP